MTFVRNLSQEGQHSHAQIAVIKEISYRIVYIMDPMNKPKKGFFRKLFAEWQEQGAMDKIKTAVAVAVFVVGIFGGVLGSVPN